jgi:hypothetical protein
MGFKIKPRQLPTRIAAAGIIINSGIGKLSADEETAAGMHGFATGTYPFLSRLRPKDFARLLGASEVALGAALLVPMVPGALAGAGLTAFASGLLGLYVRTPGMRKEGSLVPTEQGTAIAKDVWLLGIGLSLIVDDLTS